MQCIKHGVSNRSCISEKNTHDECERTQVKHTYSLRNKIQHVADVNGYTVIIFVSVSVSVSARLRNLSITTLVLRESSDQCDLVVYILSLVWQARYCTAHMGKLTFFGQHFHINPRVMKVKAGKVLRCAPFHHIKS